MSTFIERSNFAEKVKVPEGEAGLTRLWNYYSVFASTPRETGSEAAINSKLLGWAEGRGFRSEQDPTGNVLIIIPSTPGYETVTGITLQSHTDMVPDGIPNPAIYGVNPIVTEDGWVTAETTSAGLDNGIGGSAKLAVVDENIPHGPIALLFTVHEEQQMKGALNLSMQTSLEAYPLLINCDTENETLHSFEEYQEKAEAAIGSAGAEYTDISLPLERTKVGRKKQFVSMNLSGLMGGHSGLEIHEDRLNSIKAMAFLLSEIGTKIESFELESISGGKRKIANAIPKQARAVIAVDPKDLQMVKQIIEETKVKMLGKSKHDEEKKLRITTRRIKSKETVLTPDSAARAVSLLLDLPHGWTSMSQKVPGLVQTSTNLASVFTNKKKLETKMMSRSSVNEELADSVQQIETRAERFEAKSKNHDLIPGWEANPMSRIVNVVQREWTKLTGRAMNLVAKHAGLECGAIAGKFKGMEAISIGPVINNAHKVGERANIESVALFYRLLKEVIQSMALEDQQKV